MFGIAQAYEYKLNSIMKEIKFKVWDKNNKSFRKYSVPKMMGCWDIDTLDCIFMQYTGLLDRNGTEIYEGDIVESLTTIPYEVMSGEYSENHHGYYLYNHTKGFKYPLCGELKIIGNIYENQELLHG